MPARPSQGYKAPQDQPNDKQSNRIGPGDHPCRNQIARDASHDEKQGDERKETRRHSRTTDRALALQLHVFFQVSLLCGGLMSAPPSRPR